jgi:hypothetical protein
MYLNTPIWPNRSARYRVVRENPRIMYALFVIARQSSPRTVHTPHHLDITGERLLESRIKISTNRTGYLPPMPACSLIRKLA